MKNLYHAISKTLKTDESHFGRRLTSAHKRLTFIISILPLVYIVLLSFCKTFVLQLYNEFLSGGKITQFNKDQKENRQGKMNSEGKRIRTSD